MSHNKLDIIPERLIITCKFPPYYGTKARFLFGHPISIYLPTFIFKWSDSATSTVVCLNIRFYQGMTINGFSFTVQSRRALRSFGKHLWGTRYRLVATVRRFNETTQTFVFRQTNIRCYNLCPKNNENKVKIILYLHHGSARLCVFFQKSQRY